eukprot:SAG31_NODE_817_length_11849_cov_6.737362_4_plen_100_part_00
MVALLWALCWSLAAAAQPLQRAPDPDLCPTATQGSNATPVAESLRSVGIRERGAATEELLKEHGFWTALDLCLLRAGGGRRSRADGPAASGRDQHRRPV